MGVGCKSCVRPSPPPFLLLCDGIGADLRRRREGKERSRGAHLHLITPWSLARYKTLCGATDPSDSRNITLNETQRRGDAGSAYHYHFYHLGWGKQTGGHQKLSLSVATIDLELLLLYYQQELFELFFFKKQGILLLRITSP